MSAKAFDEVCVRQELDPKSHRDFAAEVWNASRASLLADAPDVEGIVAWLFTCRKPGKRMEYASVSEGDTLHWPVDQWAEIIKTPLVPVTALLAQQARIRELEGELAQARAELAAEEIRHGQSINCQKIERARAEKAEAERDALREDAERLDWFERRCGEGGSPALINDDNGHWAVAEDGIQNCPDGDGPQTITTSFWIEAELWMDSVRAAIDAARKGEA